MRTNTNRSFAVARSWSIAPRGAFAIQIGIHRDCARYMDALLIRDEDDDLAYETDYGNGNLGMADSGLETRQFYLQDAGYSTRYTLLPDATMGLACDYSPYGDIAAAGSHGGGGGLFIYQGGIVAWTVPGMFHGYEWDLTCGMHHVRNRSLNIATGRWQQRDPLGYADGMNLYQYVKSAPDRAIDPTGLNTWSDTGYWAITPAGDTRKKMEYTVEMQWECTKDAEAKVIQLPTVTKSNQTGLDRTGFTLAVVGIVVTSLSEVRDFQVTAKNCAEGETGTKQDMTFAVKWLDKNEAGVTIGIGPLAFATPLTRYWENTFAYKTYHIVVDCCCSEKKPNKNGNLVVEKVYSALTLPYTTANQYNYGLLQVIGRDSVEHGGWENPDDDPLPGDEGPSIQAAD